MDIQSIYTHLWLFGLSFILFFSFRLFEKFLRSKHSDIMPAKTPINYSEDAIDARDSQTESGYVSGGSSEDYMPEIVFTKPHLQFLNRQLQFLEPQG